MQYFRHPELVDSYHVSLKTVHNWIDATKSGKLEIQLYELNGKTYIANTPKNTTLLEELAAKGKKYRNGINHKDIQPTPMFYEVYNRRQILDIITSINVHKEIPIQYCYMEEGAANWDNWLKRMADENAPHTLKGTVELIRSNMDSIDRLLEGNKKVNIIDLGVGNGWPVKELLGHLIEKGTLHRYIAIDISPTMLALAERNIKDWYGDRLVFEGHVRDISYERFDDLLVDDMLDNSAEETVNLVLLLGDTSVNFRSYSDIYKIVYGSMGSKDMLMYTGKPDTETSRQYFNFNTTPGFSKLSKINQYVLDLLNIDESLYDVEMGFNHTTKMRYIRIKLRTPITITFNFGRTVKKVTLEKGDTILMFRAWHHTALEIITRLEEAGFTLLQSSLTKDRQYFLSISGVETK